MNEILTIAELIIPDPPPDIPERIGLQRTTEHPASHYGTGVLLDPDDEILDGYRFRELRRRLGAWIETQERESVARALGVPWQQDIREPGIGQDDRCYACGGTLPAGSEALGAEVGGEWSWLCPGCWDKVARGGRTPRHTIEAILISHSDEFDGPDCEADHEDYRDLELLGLWPTED